LRFVDRKRELEHLERYFRRSRQKLFPVAIMGLRRVGKTRLVFEFSKGRNFLYFYVNPNKRSSDLLREFFDILRLKLSIPRYVRVDDWSSFVEVLFEFASNWIIIFDEFQYFTRIAPEVFGEFQKFIDMYSNKPMLLIFVGSMIGMMKDIFENKARPLYDRVKAKIRVKPLSFQYILEILNDIGSWSFEDKLKLYFLFGGYPKYYVSLDDLSLGGSHIDIIIRELFIDENAPYRNEGKILLGNSERKVFYSIIEAISIGKRKLSDIAAYTGIKETQLPQYMDDLVFALEAVIREVPVDAGPDTRRSLYYIAIPTMEFWFRYLHRYWSLVELGLTEQLVKMIMDDINNFFATQFEFFAREFIVELSRRGKLSFEIWKIGRWWRKKHEIDIVAIDQKNKAYLALACRWGRLTLKKALTEIERTKQHATYMKMTNKKAYYGIIAKEIQKKETLRELGYLAWDLKDIEQTYTKQKTGKNN